MDEQWDSRRDQPLAWRAYRFLWSLAAGILISVGVLVTVVTLPPGAVLGLFLSVALPTGAIVWAWSTVNLMPLRRAGAACVWSGIVVVAAQGLVWLLGGWSLLGLLAVGLGTPSLLELVAVHAKERLVRRRPASPSAVDGLVAHDLQFDDPHACRLLDPACPASKRVEIADLTTPDLGRIWKVSGKWLEHGFAGVEMAHLVHVRAACLDELERRDPRGFRRWLTVEQPCSTEPTRFIASGDGALPPDVV